jgi:glycosyltransferase involved in cell wall biosynthesis
MVLEALIRLKKEGITPLVISTGLTSDRRNPAFPRTLQDRVKASGLAERFRFLGLIPFAHVAVLMRHSAALINPSRFEGWSTTVEEAKSLGKRMLLSDLRVHREQAPSRGFFFDPDDADTLAEHMRAVIRNDDPEEERAAMKEAEACLPERMAAFGKAYETLALNIIGINSK